MFLAVRVVGKSGKAYRYWTPVENVHDCSDKK